MNGSNDKAGESEKTPFQKFHDLTKKLIRVPKSEVDKKIRTLRAGKNNGKAPCRKSNLK
jgi:hypothetical protein